MEAQLNTGALLKAFFKKHKVSKAVFARTYPCHPTTVLKHLRQTEHSTAVLLRYSIIFKHNFFADIAALLPKEFTASANPDAEKDALIAALKEEVKLLKVERDVLKEVLGKG